MESNQPGPDFFQSLPKVELHRHLEGSLRTETLAELARAFSIDLPDTALLRSLVQVEPGQPYTFENFLSKFQTLRLFYRSPEVIRRVTREALCDAALDNIRYIELRFTPAALSRAEGFPLNEVVDWVVEAARDASREYGIEAGLIVSVNRHESTELAEQVIGLAVDRRAAGIVGVDLAGNEAQFSALPFAGIFREAKQEGLHITVHAGEWGGAENVREAIEHLGAERIGHGIRVVDDPAVMALALERDVAFDICLTSNIQSGAVPSLGQHPLRKMLAAGLKASLNTDDPSISGITLTDEYRLAVRGLDLPAEVLFELLLNAARATFLPELERQRLAGAISQLLPAV